MRDEAITEVQGQMYQVKLSQDAVMVSKGAQALAFAIIEVKEQAAG